MRLIFSIIIPVYNVERYLKVCLESVAQQHLSDYEVIMVDDGSTDGSGAICDEYTTKYPQFRVVHQENHGISVARNRGLAEAQGEYVLFIDSDDFLIPETIGPLLRYACLYRLDILGFQHRTVPEEADMASVSNVAQSKEYIINELNKEPETLIGIDFIANHNYTVQVWWYLVRRAVLSDNHIQFPVGHMLEDAAFDMRLFLACERIALVPIEAYCYRQRPTSIMNNSNKSHRLKLMRDYLFAAKDVDDTINSNRSSMTQACYERCCTRRDSYVLFGAIRAFKLGKVREYLQEAKSLNVYPFERLSVKDYPGGKFKLLHWLVTKPRLWRLLSSIYCIFR